MAARVYTSNISKLWPLARQHDVLAKVQGWEKLPRYTDTLTRRGLQARTPDLLEERGDMLRPTSRRSGETIYVASLAVLAFGATDLVNVLAAAAARRATIEVLADDLTIPPDAPAAVVAEVMAAWERAKRRALTEGGRLAGVKVATERRRAATAVALDKVREDWSRPSDEVSTAELIERSGLTYKTLHEHFGPRKKAQRARLRKEQRAARREPSDDAD